MDQCKNTTLSLENVEIKNLTHLTLVSLVKGWASFLGNHRYFTGTNKTKKSRNTPSSSGRSWGTIVLLRDTVFYNGNERNEQLKK